MNRDLATGIRLPLQLHPASVCEAVRAIEVTVARSAPSRLVLTYSVVGALSHVRIPPPAASERRDGLWQQTCFEAFLRHLPDPAYYEFNFAPSSQWAAYRFHDYRSGMEKADAVTAPRIEWEMGKDGLQLTAVVDFDRLADLPGNRSLRLGLSAVIEETNGRKSYWALVHPSGNADFHHVDCFALQLPEYSET